VLTLRAFVVAERLGHPHDTALTFGRAVAGSAARVKARSIGREERKTDREADTPRLREEHVTAPVFVLGRRSGCCRLPMATCAPRITTSRPIPAGVVQRYVEKAFGDHLVKVREAMEQLAGRHEPAELNRIGFRLYEKFRPEIPPGNKGWHAAVALK